MKILSKGIYYGSKKSELHINGIILSEYNYDIPRTDWHFHENPYFMYLLQGNLYDYNKKRKTNCPNGSLLLHNWQEQHCNEKESQFARGFHIEFERKWFEDKKLNIELWEGSQLIINPRLYHLIGKLYYEFKTQDEYSELAIELLLLQLCENTQEIQSQSLIYEPSWVKDLKELLHDAHEKISLKSLSEQLGVHPVHISRAIPKYLSVNLGEYLRQAKIKQSLNFLIDNKYSLTEVAYKSGFSDQSHFTKTFKSYFGMTPKVYERMLHE